MRTPPPTSCTTPAQDHHVIPPTAVGVEAVRASMPVPVGSDHECVGVEAVHADGLMARIAALVNPFPVTAFTYRRSADGGKARAAICLEGTEWQVERVAHKIRRIIGVLAVRTDPAGHDA